MSATTPAREGLLTDLARGFAAQKASAERAMEQVDDGAFFTTLGSDENSIGIIAKHMSGNLLSRFTDFLTSDGEKPSRNRDGEFEVAGAESRESVMAQWGRGWSTLESALASLTPADLSRTIHIRGEPATALQALLRALAHQAQHAGQIVLLAKHLAGENWTTLTIPRPGKR